MSDDANTIGQRHEVRAITRRVGPARAASPASPFGAQIGGPALASSLVPPYVKSQHWPLRNIAVFALLVFVGCDDPQAPTRTRPAVTSTQPAREHIDDAMKLLENLDQFREQQAQVKTAYHLNRWLESQKLRGDWKPDEMVARLPRAVREQGVATEFSRRTFSTGDVLSIQEAVWMRQLSQWVSRQTLPPHFSRWLESRQAQLGTDTAERLAIAFRLFDWTVRNIRLDPLQPYPEEAAGAPKAGTEATQATVPAALRALPGPGYYLEPWQVLVYGQGDAWQRMRIFTLLARQQGIDVVTLAFPGRSIPPRPRPWVSAVLLNKQLYLFDARLGLPIPGKQLEGIATLEEVLDDLSLLTALSAEPDHPYKVEKQDLDELSALLDVTPAALSQRVQLLESQLTGEHRTILTVGLTPLARRLRECRGLYDVYVWSVPFEAIWYRDAVEQRIRNDEMAAAQYAFQYGMFQNHSPLARARYMYFRGQMENQDDNEGAKALLLQARVNQEHLEQMTSNVEVQKQMGLQRTARHTDQMWQAQIAGIKSMMIDTKQHASFWLGLFQFESASYDSAIEWLKSRTLEAWPEARWAAAARYNLARTYEAKGDLATAQQLLLTNDDSPQEHGNYLRARLLQQELQRGESKPQPVETETTKQ